MRIILDKKKFLQMLQVGDEFVKQLVLFSYAQVVTLVTCVIINFQKSYTCVLFLSGHSRSQ